MKISGSSVAIDSFYVMYAVRSPDKTQAKLIIDANAVLVFQITQQRLQSVTRWASQGIQRCGAIAVAVPGFTGRSGFPRRHNS